MSQDRIPLYPGYRSLNIEDTAGHLWYIKYPVEDPDEYIVVATTTRSETMLGGYLKLQFIPRMSAITSNRQICNSAFSK